MFLQGDGTDFDGDQFADVQGAQVGQVFVLFRHAKARVAADGRFHILLLLLGRFERSGRGVQAVLRPRIEFGNLGIRLGEFLKKKQKCQVNGNDDQRKRERVQSASTNTTAVAIYLVLIYRVDDAVVVQHDDVRMALVERDVPDGAGSIQPLGRQMLRQFLGEGRVLATADVVLDDLVVGVGHQQQSGRRMEGQSRRMALIAGKSRMDLERL